MAAKAEDLSVSSRLERLLHFVTSHSARDVPKVGIGSDCDSPRFENMARKLPVKFRLLEAAGRHWILTTQLRHSIYLDSIGS